MVVGSDMASRFSSTRVRANKHAQFSRSEIGILISKSVREWERRDSNMGRYYHDTSIWPTSNTRHDPRLWQRGGTDHTDHTDHADLASWSISTRVDRSATSRRSRVVPVPNRALSLSVAAISRAIAAVSRSIAAVSRSIAAISRSIAAVSRSIAVVSRSIAVVSRSIAAISRSIAVVGAVSRPIASRSVSDRPIAVAIGEGKWQQAPACRARRHIQTLTKHKAQSATALDDTKPHRTHMTPPPPSPRCHVAASLLCRSRARARTRGGGGVTRGAHAARSAPSSGRTGRRRRRLARARVVR